MHTPLLRGRAPALAAAVLLGALALGVTGCGGKVGTGNEVSGTVKFNGKPLNSGSINFIPQDDPNQKFASVIDESGHYSLPNVPEGTFKVTVEVPIRSSNPKAPPPVQIPPGYARPAMTKLTCAVT